MWYLSCMAMAVAGASSVCVDASARTVRGWGWRCCDGRNRLVYFHFPHQSGNTTGLHWKCQAVDLKCSSKEARC